MGDSSEFTKEVFIGPDPETLTTLVNARIKQFPPRRIQLKVDFDATAGWLITLVITKVSLKKKHKLTHTTNIDDWLFDRVAWSDAKFDAAGVIHYWGEIY